jgi:hypothetical protein
MMKLYYFKKYFINQSHKLIRNSTKITQLGRWKINDHNKTNIKIDQANQDNCGTCLFQKQ